MQLHKFSEYLPRPLENTSKYRSLEQSEQIVQIAQTWIGVPYQHQASTRFGCDCLGLIRGVWREVYGQEPESPPAYTMDWGETKNIEFLLMAAQRHLIETPLIPTASMPTLCAGDVLLFRMRPMAVCKHLGIFTGDGHMIHAVSGRAVMRTRLTKAWCMKIAYRFSWPAL